MRFLPASLINYSVADSALVVVESVPWAAELVALDVAEEVAEEVAAELDAAVEDDEDVFDEVLVEGLEGLVYLTSSRMAPLCFVQAGI